MAKPLRVTRLVDLNDLQTALACLRDARNYARRANANVACKAINRALKSTDGALRHARRALPDA